MKSSYLFGTLFIVLLIASCKSTIKDEVLKSKILTIQTKGIEYDSLFIRNANIMPLIKGEKADSITWKFQISDSTINTVISFEIQSKTFDWNTKTTFKTSFVSNINGEDLFTHQLAFEDNQSSVTIQYKDSKTIDNIYLRAKTPEGADTTVIGKINQTIFTIQPVKGSETYIRLLDPFYSMFLGKNDTTYQEYMNRYVKLAKQYPDSKYLISQLADNLQQYKDKKDVLSIYECLSEKYKKTAWGQAVESYLTARFENCSLPNALTEENVPIIKDSTRYTIVIFSASWCGPCHKQLPIQKEVYEKLKNKVDFVTISIDEENSVKQWQEFVIKENIPWRSLLAYKDIDGIRKKYYVPHIPYTILVHPDRNFEPFSLWEENDINKMYELISSK